MSGIQEDKRVPLLAGIKVSIHSSLKRQFKDSRFPNWVLTIFFLPVPPLPLARTY